MAKKENVPKTYTVSSKSSQTGRAVTFNLPHFRRLNLSRPILRSNRNRIAAGIVILILISGASGYGGAAFQDHNNQGEVLTSNVIDGSNKVVTTQSQLISQIVKNIGPSVVSVNVDISSSSSSSSADGSDGLFGFSQPEDEEAAGTGIVISSSGIIMTNRHVVPDGTTSVSVTLSDGTELKDVSVIGRTSTSDSLDLAFLKINNAEGHKLVPAAIGDSSKVQVGDNVVAIGNALGQFQNTVTSGIISGYGRSVTASDDGSDGSSSDSENLDDLFQTDAAINEGNSGGPLVNLNGQVIGINVATAGDAQNIGFSIPIDDAKGLMEQVLKTGKFEQAYLGVRYIPLTADIANEYNLSVQNGAFIAPSDDSTSPSVISGSPADKAGIQTNDIITQVDGTNVDQTHSLTSLLSPHVPGDKIDLTIVRRSKTIHLTVTLGSEPSS
jgi:serine protease Do